MASDTDEPIRDEEKVCHWNHHIHCQLPDNLIPIVIGSNVSNQLYHRFELLPISSLMLLPVNLEKFLMVKS